MGGRFDGADLALRATCYHRESRFHGGPFVVGIDFEVAEELFGDRILRIVRLQVGTRPQANFRNRTGKLGRTLGAIGYGAGHRVDDDVFRTGIILGAVRILDSEHIADTFDQSILKAAAGAEEGPVTPAGEFNAFQHAIKTFIRTAWRRPNSVETLQFLFCARLQEARGCDPLAFDGQIQLGGGMLERLLDSRKSRRLGIVIPENSYADGIAHLAILVEKLGSARRGR